MNYVFLGAALFAIPHFLSQFFPTVRDRLIARFGEGAFKGGYSIVTVFGLALMVYGYWTTRGDGTIMFQPAASMRHVSMVLATVGIILVAAMQGKSHLRLWVQNPFSIGIILWSTAHLLSVAKPAAAWFFLTMLAIGLVDVALSVARGEKPNFAPVWRSDIIAVVVGLVVTALLVLLFHPYVLGVRLFQ